MKIHSDKLLLSDIYDAQRSLTGVWFAEMYATGSRKRQRGYVVRLSGTSNRWVNSGKYGAGHLKAATWDEWGYFLANLYRIDPDLIASDTGYANADDFHTKTGGKYK